MEKINLAISNIAWSKEYDKEMYSFLSERGFNLEIAPTRIFQELPYDCLSDAEKFAQELINNYNIRLVSMQSIWYGKTEKIFESEENFKSLVEYTKKAVNFAKAIGCGNLVFGNPKNRVITNHENDYNMALKFFTEIGKYALENDVVIAVEPNPVIYGTNFLNESKDAFDFVKKINLDSVKVNYDLGTVLYNNESIDVLKQNIELVNHIHVSEPNLDIIKEREIHKDLLEIINNSNYSGYISIEMKKCNDLKIVKDAVDYIKSCCREVVS